MLVIFTVARPPGDCDHAPVRSPMKAAVLQQPKKFTIDERPVPAAGLGRSVVRIAATAVCHTDFDLYLGQHPGVPYPILLGHEATGTVASIGAGVTGLKPGQNVIINPVISCGQCDCCQRGDEHLCRNAGILGREFEGSLSQYVRLAARYVYPLPQHLPLAEATMIETLATVHHAQVRAGIKPGESIVVLGQGPTGLLHTRLAVLNGCKPVIAVSRSQWKIDLAESMGAKVVRTDVDEAAEPVKRQTNGNGADVVVDTVGSTGTLRAGIKMLRPGGRFLSFSLGHSDFRAQRVRPVHQGNQHHWSARLEDRRHDAVDRPGRVWQIRRVAVYHRALPSPPSPRR